MNFLEQIRIQASAWTVAEFVAVLAAVLYLLLAIRQNIWCWFFAAISTAIYIWVFFAAKLYMESFLNVFYLLMAGYGWSVWRRSDSRSAELPVSTWPLARHAVSIIVVSLLSGLSGWVLSSTDAAFPYVDSATTWFAIFATFLVARKILENWWYWLVIDLASIFIYWARDLQLTSALFAVYVCMIPFGLIAWTRSYREEIQ